MTDGSTPFASVAFCASIAKRSILFSRASV
jgi:hypothetical protein